MTFFPNFLNAKPCEKITWHLHKRKRSFDLVGPLDERDFGKIYAGFSDRYREVSNLAVRNNPQLTMDYFSDWT